MEHWWIMLQMSKIKQYELLQEAARFRLLLNAGGSSTKYFRAAHHENTRPMPLWAKFRCNLGQRLIEWGKLLKQPSAQKCPPADRTM